MSDPGLSRQESKHVSYIRERLNRCRAMLLGFEEWGDQPLHGRLTLAYQEGFNPTLTDLFAEAHEDLKAEWLAIGEEFASVRDTLALMPDQDLEEIEARVLAFVDRYLTVTEPNWDHWEGRLED